MRTTISALADELNVSVSNVKKCLRASPFANAQRKFASADTRLSSDEASYVRAQHARAPLDGERSHTQDVEATSVALQPILGDRRPGLAMPSLGTEGRRDFGAPSHRIFVHRDVREYLSSSQCTDAIRRACTHRARQLMTYGRTTRCKGVRGRNEGWTRVALGGNSGFHHYLWLLSRGDSLRGDRPAALYDALPEGSRLLRAIRHHDETTEGARLAPGSIEDYVEWTADELFGLCEPSLRDPLTDDQRAVATCAARVRLIEGHPGAGKTTTLFAVGERLEGRVLYLTLNDVLVDQAQRWFATAMPRDAELTAMSWETFVRRIDPARTVVERSVDERVRALLERVRPLGARLGPWMSKGAVLGRELYDELHAHWFGAALPVDFRGRPAVDDPHLTEEGYRALRRASLGEAAVNGAIAAANLLDDPDGRALFASPVRAFELARGLARGNYATGELAFDWVLVDEVQDLTLVEQWLLLDWIGRMASRGDRLPAVILAGDEAQTVRPTAFEWASLRRMASERLGARGEEVCAPRELHENLRSPHDLAVFLNNARRCLYRCIDKQQRPRGAALCEPADSTVGRVVALEWGEADEGLRAVFRSFARAGGSAALVVPGASVPDALASLAREENVVLWTSESAKGLEFRVVGVLRVREAFERVRTHGAGKQEEKLRGELARSAADHLLVALSRSAETLVLLSERWSDAELRALDAMQAASSDDATSERSSHGRFVLAELDALIDADADGARDKVEALIDQSATCSARGAHEESEMLARNACSLLGTSGRPGAASAELRARARRRWAHALVQLALSGSDMMRWPLDLLQSASAQWRYAKDTERAKVVSDLRSALGSDPRELDTIHSFADVVGQLPWLDVNDAMLGAAVLRALQAKVAQWEREALVPKTDRGRAALLDALRALHVSASSGRDVFGLWYAQITRIVRDWWLANSNDPRDAATIREHLTGEERAVFDAWICEKTGNWTGAASAWEALEQPAAALRCLRAAGEYARAAALAERFAPDEAASLRWLADVLALLAAPPPVALDEQDAERLRAAIARSVGARSGERPRRTRRAQRG